MGAETGKSRVSIWWLSGAAFLVLGLVVFGCEAGPRVWGMVSVRERVRKNPLLNLVPVPLADLKRSPNLGEELNYLGVKFRTPWGSPSAIPSRDIPAVKTVGSYTRLQFKQGQAIAVMTNLGDSDKLTYLKKIGDAEGLRKMFGDDVPKTNYELARRIRFSRPEQASLLNGWNAFVRGNIMLTFKSGEVFKADTGLFSFEFNDVRGFQRGDPAKSPSIMLNIFTKNDHECLLIVVETAGTQGKVTQEDINAILGSMEEAEAGQ